MLTGRLPFTTKDPMGLVHSHIARLPIPPHELNSKIPKTISDIIMKLMNKMAEERYQSTFGIKCDLKQCLDILQRSGKLEVFEIETKAFEIEIEAFEIGQKDISDRLRIPQKLYGRESEIETLLTGFDQVSRGACKMVLVTGQAGIGKSALVNEVQRPIVQRPIVQKPVIYKSKPITEKPLTEKPITEKSIKNEKRYFISGKFDQLKKSIPYAPLIHAFKELIQHLLTESDEQLLIWKEKLLKALGPNGRVIIDVIPDLEYIIGKQPEVPEVGPVENVNRFNYVFENFIKTFASG